MLICVTAILQTEVTWKDVQKALKPGEAAIEMVRFNWFNKTWTDTVYYAALIVTPETREHPEMVVLTNGNALEDRNGIYDEEYLRGRGRTITKAYQYYWQPIQEKLAGVRKVYFSPDGIYNVINLNILYNPENQKYLGDEIDVHLVTNTKDILEFGKPTGKTKTAALFGRPAFDLGASEHVSAARETRFASVSATGVSDFERRERSDAIYDDLPGTEAEVNNIAELLEKNGWSAQVSLGKNALEEAVKAVESPAVLHIATHGFFISKKEQAGKKRFQFLQTGDNQPSPYLTNAMLRSGLVLAGAKSWLEAEEKPQTEDGVLTAYEARNLNS